MDLFLVKMNFPEIFLLFQLIFLCLTVAFSEWNTKDYLKKENSLTKPYSDERWDYIGSTIITNSYVRLTPDHQSRKGAIWNTAPCLLRDWELHVHFKVHGKGNDLFGDGFAIWYTKDRSELGPVFGNKDFFVGLGVFFDTYVNQNTRHSHGHPYISAMVSNGSLHYDHDRDGTHTELAGCESHFRQTVHETYVAVRYERNKLKVSTDIHGKNSWVTCFEVNGVKLPTGYYFGASAATGELADNHDIISMKLYDIGISHADEEDSNSVDYSKIEPSAEFYAPHRDHIKDESSSDSSGWSGVFIFFLILLAVGVVGVVAYALIGKSQDRKRLY